MRINKVYKGGRSWMVLVGPDKRLILWPTWGEEGMMSALCSPGRKHLVPVPVWLYRAWLVGEPVEPLIDWLIENALDKYPELADLFQQAAQEA